MAGQLPTYSVEEIARRGDEIYEKHIRSQVEAGNRGKVVAIDVHTGDYALADTATAAGRLLRERRPDAEIWFVRVGYPGLYKIGYVPVAEGR